MAAPYHAVPYRTVPYRAKPPYSSHCLLPGPALAPLPRATFARPTCCLGSAVYIAFYMYSLPRHTNGIGMPASVFLASDPYYSLLPPCPGSKPLPPMRSFRSFPASRRTLPLATAEWLRNSHDMLLPACTLVPQLFKLASPARESLGTGSHMVDFGPSPAHGGANYARSLALCPETLMSIFRVRVESR
ncbi:hypothetical protein BS50DRAFT_578567 [Corynespora cassiicola Philippines]|uniref:Uncharacterized protein n=1 Tax=Corynespora cassiicola Philippines TaxID=1448308 RepID=A0A2T2N707_CORCC|nr:hypothetical protein BS50DRAFT_578567 [Corynespora cassiicola Philippines]